MTQTKSPQSTPTEAASAGLLPFWRWWTGELTAMLPTSMARWLDGDAIATNVALDETGLTIVSATGSAARSSPPQPVPTDALANSPVLRALIAAGRDQVRLVLTPEQALLKTITLPLATEENLREVVGFELDRHTPFTPDQAYYDVQVVRRDPQNEKIVVSLAVASKPEMAALIDTLRRAGLTCTAIGIAEGATSNAGAFDLQPIIDKPPRRLSRSHQINLALLGLVAALLFAAVILPIWQKREAVKALNPQAQKSGAEFQISERVYSEYTKLVAEYNFLATRKHAIHPVLAVLEELARTFPDTTWVQRLELKLSGKVREVIMIGEAQSASKVIENLEQSPMSLFQNSKQLTPTSRMQLNTERFHVSAEIKPRPVPAAESIDDVAAPPAIAPTATVAPAIPTAVVTSTSPGVPPAGVAAPLLTPMQPVPPAAPASPAGPPTASSAVTNAPPLSSLAPSAKMSTPAPATPAKRSGS